MTFSNCFSLERQDANKELPVCPSSNTLAGMVPFAVILALWCCSIDLLCGRLCSLDYRDGPGGVKTRHRLCLWWRQLAESPMQAGVTHVSPIFAKLLPLSRSTVQVSQVWRGLNRRAGPFD